MNEILMKPLPQFVCSSFSGQFLNSVLSQTDASSHVPGEPEQTVHMAGGTRSVSESTELSERSNSSEGNQAYTQILAAKCIDRLSRGAKNDANYRVPVFRQLSECIRDAIVDGTIPLGTVLPSMRELGEAIGVSRSTVMRTFADLLSQDYVQLNIGSCSRVCRVLPGTVEQVIQQPGARVVESDDSSLSAYARRLMWYEKAGYASRCTLSAPPPQSVPQQLWRSLYRTYCNKIHEIHRDRDPMGRMELRRAYAAYLIRARAAKCSAEQVGVFFSQELRLDLILRLLLKSGDYVAIENPCQPNIRTLFESRGVNVISINADHRGMCVDDLEALALPIKFVYVTPSGNEPTGAVMPMARRQKLLDWAKRCGAFIIEDDFSSHYLYQGRTLPSLQSLDENDCVIYISCFSQVLAPLVKFGFMVLPHCLIDTVAAAKSIMERDMPTVEQVVLSEFISSGHLNRVVRRNRQIFGARQRKLIDELSRLLGRRVTAPECGGLEMVVRFESDLHDEEIEAIAARCNFPLVSTASYYHGEKRSGEFLVPFASLDDQSMQSLAEFAFALKCRLMGQDEQSGLDSFERPRLTLDF